MAIRKNMGKGRGKGFKNLIPKQDSRTHSQSARGIKQPQRISKTKFLIRPPKKSEVLFGSNKQITQTNLIEKTINGLDPFEKRIFKQNFERTKSFEKSFELLVNEVEGDTSQLSSALKEYAEKKGLLKGFEDNQKEPESCMTDQQVWEERSGHYYDDNY